jgi:peptide/nickel transport system ATP-binding protein
VQAGILNVLRDLRDRLGTSILVITHDLGVIADVADRVVVMYAGRVVERAGVDELFARPQHHYTAGLLSASPAPGRHAGTDRLQEIPGLVPVLSSQPDACTFAERCPAADARCVSSAPPLAPGALPVGVPAVQARAGQPTSDHLVACWHPVGAPGTTAREAAATADAVAPDVAPDEAQESLR